MNRVSFDSSTTVLVNKKETLGRLRQKTWVFCRYAKVSYRTTSSGDALLDVGYHSLFSGFSFSCSDKCLISASVAFSLWNLKYITKYNSSANVSALSAIEVKLVARLVSITTLA